MQAKLVCQVEGKRWFVEFVGGYWNERQGDYEIRGVPESQLVKGACFECPDLPPYHRPTLSHYCGILILKPNPVVN
jgi:hypothetical protein